MISSRHAGSAGRSAAGELGRATASDQFLCEGYRICARPIVPIDRIAQICHLASTHDPNRTKSPTWRRGRPVRRVPRARSSCSGTARRRDRPRAARRHVPPRRLRRDARLPPAAHPPRVPDAQARRVHARRPRLDVRPGPGHRLGRRPPQAPRAHRRGGRPALARTSATAPASAPARPLARARRLAHERAGHGASSARYAPDLSRTRACAGSPATSWLDRPAGLALPRCSASRSPAGRSRRAHRPALGRPRARLPPAPRTWTINSVCHFFGTRRFDDRRPVAQRLVAGAAVARRGLASQPPRLPALGRARPAPRGARPAGWVVARR